MHELWAMNLLIEGPKMHTKSKKLQYFLYVYNNFLAIFSCSTKSIGGNTGSGIQTTSADQFLRTIRKDAFGPTEIQFDMKTEVILTRLRTDHVKLNAY